MRLSSAYKLRSFGISVLSFLVGTTGVLSAWIVIKWIKFLEFREHYSQGSNIPIEKIGDVYFDQIILPLIAFIPVGLLIDYCFKRFILKE